MIDQFEVINYRGLRDLTIDPMKRVNLITGPNGVGKTSLVEALFLFHGRYNPTVIWSPHVRRRSTVEPNPLIGLGELPVELIGTEDGQRFGVKYEYEELVSPLPIPIDIGEGSDGGSKSEGNGYPEAAIPPSIGRLNLTYSPDIPTRTQAHDVILGPAGPALARNVQIPRRPLGVLVTRIMPFPIGSDTIERYSGVVAQGEKRQLLDMLALIQPSIQDIELLSSQNRTSLWADVGTKELLPLESLGGGIVRLLVLFVNLYAAKDGFVAIDEIDNGIHHSALPQLWQHILEISQLLNVQCIATTHSLECVRAAANAAETRGSTADLALHQMHIHDQNPRVETYTNDKLLAAIDLGFEVR